MALARLAKQCCECPFVETLSLIHIWYTNEQLYNLTNKIINGSANCFLGEAYNVSYTDVYDFSSKKQSLKKFEIELGIHHQELGLQMCIRDSRYSRSAAITFQAMTERRT